MVAIYADYIKNNKPEKTVFHLPYVLIKETSPYAYLKPVYDKDNVVTIALACDDGYMKYTTVLLQSILDNSSNKFFYDIVIMHRDITESSMSTAKSIFRNHDNFSLRFVNVKRNFEKYSSLHISRHLSLETYYRFMITDIFKDYDKVLYLDCDMIVLKDLSELFFTDIDNYYIGAVKDIDFIASYREPERKLLYDKEIMTYIGFEDATDYFQAGMILFNIKNIKKDFTTDMFFEKAMSRNWFYHDQDVLNSIFHGNIKYLDIKWNVFSLLENNSARSSLIKDYLCADLYEQYKSARDDIGIVHFGGVPKPWNTTQCDMAYYFWQYARKSPYYETLLGELYSDTFMPTGKLIFNCDNNYTDNVGAPIFEINLLKDVWSENYIEISFTYLSDHNTPSANATLSIDVSLLSNNIFRVNKFQFAGSENTQLFRDTIGYILDENKFIIYARFLCRYEGFAWKATLLESRSFGKPEIKVLKNDYVTSSESLKHIHIVYENGGN